MKLILYCIIVILCSLQIRSFSAPTLIKPPHNANLEAYLERVRQKREQQNADLLAAKEPVTRRTLIAHLLPDLGGKDLKEENSIRRLGRIRAKEVVWALVERLDFMGVTWQANHSIPDMGEMYPVVEALIQIGQPSIPIVIEAVAAKERSEDFRNNAVHTVRDIINDGNNEATRALFFQYLTEYDQKAYRLRVLADQKMDATLKKPVLTSKVVVGGDTKTLTSRWEKFLTLTALINDKQVVNTNSAKVAEAILELGQLQLVEATPDLAEKLDFAADTAGTSEKTLPLEEGYPAVKALIELAEPALSAVADAVATRGASKLARDNGVYVIQRITGSPEATKKALLFYAEENKKKAQRLREIVKTIPKVN